MCVPIPLSERSKFRFIFGAIKFLLWAHCATFEVSKKIGEGTWNRKRDSLKWESDNTKSFPGSRRILAHVLDVIDRNSGVLKSM